ncbi:hypothetical protein [Sphingomonas sp. 8AM]|uniref:hypothetical protein n=1 Tax=Sphingomonas sp. 8AM TaxID=2653170 RepID=UPI0012F179BE|nr:hypothetical protein [Sphingomonas sp. 8AM]VXD02940.1 conserved hypothetical protein [Sphingomonas sp. 8AM]
MASLTPTDAALSATTPAFVQAPTFVFATNAPAPSRSEVLRQQIAAARTARRATIW